MRRFTHAAACFFITCGVWAVPIALAVAARVAAAAEPQAPQATPVAFACDGRAGVTAIAIKVDKPGTYAISWDNRRACGTAT